MPSLSSSSLPTPRFPPPRTLLSSWILGCPAALVLVSKTSSPTLPAQLRSKTYLGLKRLQARVSYSGTSWIAMAALNKSVGGHGEQDISKYSLVLPDGIILDLKLTLPGKVEFPDACLSSTRCCLDIAYDKVCKDEKDCIKRVTKAEEAFKKYSGSDENPPKEKAFEKAQEAATKARDCKANQVISLYSNLLTEEARCPWKKIVSEQTGCAP
eukprot:CCRYP_003743-RA/>CCRYP_003743-RA protein AED:0.64 eAED:0.86 QI:0/0/0/1/1/1/3/0/211